MEARVLSQHIVKRFDADLLHLRGRVGEFGALVQAQVEVAARAVVNGDRELAGYAENMHGEVRSMRVALDQECNWLIARRAPIASDLRLVIACLKTLSDLERAGNEARKIAGFARHLAESGEASEASRGVRHLADLAGQLLAAALRAFMTLDADAALEVWRSDSEVDREYDSLQRQSITYMLERVPSCSHIIDVLWVGRSLERIGDHAKNMAEYVVYVVYGKDVRHKPLREVELEIANRQAATA